MTTASSGLSPEAKEFVPLVQNPPSSIPMYVDENAVASIYPSDQQPLMIQAIYPMMITNSKVTDNLSFPEIEFHIQPSQQQQFHIDSCTNIQQQSSTNGNTSSNNPSQIVLLPITNPTTAVTLTGYYPEPPLLYSPNEQPVSAFYPIDYCDQPLINFSLQQPTSITKSNRNSSQQQQQRPSSFRQHHGAYRPSSRGGNRGNGHNPNRNPYHDYNNNSNPTIRRNGPSSHISSSGRGNSINSKRISSYHQNDYNNYYHHHPSTRSRGYLSRTTQQHDERRKDHLEYYNNDNDPQQLGRMNDDGTLFEFRPEDFPSLPININNNNSQQSDKPSIILANTQPASSWNAIVSATRPRSISPHSVTPSQDQRSDRSRSFNNKLSTNNERKSSTKKPIVQPPATTKSPNHASKNHSNAEQELPQQPRSKSLTNNNESSLNENTNKDDGFIQTKQQHRRLKRRHKIKEELPSFVEPSNTNDTAPYVLDDENTFPTLGQQPIQSRVSQELEQDTDFKLINKSNLKTDLMNLTDTFDSLNLTAQSKQENSNNITKMNINNSSDSKTVSKHGKEREPAKSRKSTKIKRSINKENEENQKQQIESLPNTTVEEKSNEKNSQNETDTQTAIAVEINHKNSNPLSSTSNNSSDTSDYDDAVDNFDAE